MEFDALKQKANSLPLAPGVYIMRDKNDTVIYVGKAKKLKNRVSQYFQDTAAHSPKTRMMVSKIDHFEVIVASSEFEALILECSLIKRYLPKYNILLKDDKGYPYVRLDLRESYPRFTVVSRILDDGAEYFGPYGSRGVTQNILDAIRLTFQLPACAKKFPRDIGRDRSCLNYHMNQCAGWCQPNKGCEDYLTAVQQARQLLLGNYKTIADQIRRQMQDAAESLNFELAAELRDRLASVEALGQKQLVTAGTLSDTDVVGFAQTETKCCFAVLHFSAGNLLDKDYEVHAAVEDPEAAVSSLIKQYYLSRGFAPRRILLPFQLDDMKMFSQLLEQRFGRRPKCLVPQRGDNARLSKLANSNAFEEASRVTSKDEKVSGAVQRLRKMLMLESLIRVEAFDISNTSGTDIVGGMVVFQDGKPRRSEYKRFKIKNLENQDDYASMHQVVTRRFVHYINGDKGFSETPDLLLIDGGAVHASVAAAALGELGLNFPVFGMVKDDRHRTRALVTPEGQEIAIDGQQSVFSLIGNLQEETHRFAISYHRHLRSKRLRYSQLDEIPGIGPKRKQELLKKFKSLSAIASATQLDLERYLPRNTAQAVYSHFHNNESK